MMRSLRASRNGLRRALHAVAPRPVPESAIPPPPPSAAGEVDFEWLKHACKRLESQSERLERKLDAVQADLASFRRDKVEDQVRAAVPKEFRREYFTAKSIVDLVAMLDKDSVEKLAGFAPPPPADCEGAGGGFSSVIAVADRVCIRLLEEDVPRKLLQFILNEVARSITDDKTLTSISLLLGCPTELPRVDSTMEGAYEHVIRILTEGKLVILAENVQKVWSLMQITTRKDKVAFLRGCEGPGLMCLHEMTGLCPWGEPYLCLEYGLRGRIQAGEGPRGAFR